MTENKPQSVSQERSKEELRRRAESAGLRLSDEEFEALGFYLRAILPQLDRLSELALDDTGPVTIFDPRKQ